jgi:hypothetical protein
MRTFEDCPADEKLESQSADEDLEKHLKKNMDSANACSVGRSANV